MEEDGDFLLDHGPDESYGTCSMKNGEIIFDFAGPPGTATGRLWGDCMTVSSTPEMLSVGFQDETYCLVPGV